MGVAAAIGAGAAAASAGSALSGGGGGQPTNQVSQQNQIPQWMSDAGQQNYDIAQSIASQPYPVYQGATVAPLSYNQQHGIYSLATNPFSGDNSIGSAYSGLPLLQAGAGVAQGVDPNAALNTNKVQAAMSPYIQAALNPQIADLQDQLGMQQRQTDAQATGAGAFGDARHGVESAMNNYYGDRALNALTSQGYNTAFNNAQSTLNNANTQSMQQAGLLGQLGGETQQNALQGANAMLASGAVQQQNDQSQLTAAYNNFWNQVNWPKEQLNTLISALSGTPYTTTRLTTFPPANNTAGNLGMFAALAGGSGLGKA